MSIFSKIGDAFKHVASDIGKGLEGAGHMLTSAAKLDFKGVADGFGEIQRAGADVMKQAVMMSPLGMAANTLTNGALDKIMTKAQDLGSKVVDGVVQGIANDATMVKDGSMTAMHGLATGNLGEVVSGGSSAVMGAASLAETLNPEGLAVTTAMSAANVGTQELMAAT